MSGTRFRVSNGLLLEVCPDDEEGPVRIHGRGETAAAVIVRPEEIDPLIAALMEAGDRLRSYNRLPPEDGGALRAQGLMPPPAHTRHRG